ncbi:MAG TPA: hypothetical protein VFP84_20565 [Kofleriaceae bacterium]|nr:hypothetical protein [Kofleriaceae bacterium]
MPRRLAGLTAVHVLLLVAFLEVAINRVAVPMLRPAGSAPPAWHTYLDYAGLFLFYFAGTLATLVLVARSVRALRTRGRGVRATFASLLVLIATGLAALPLASAVPAIVTVALEAAFACALIALAASAPGKQRDLGLQIGLPLLVIPLVLHSADAIGAHFVWPDNMFDGPGVVLERIGVLAVCFVALITPYCFAPRPFARAVIRPLPVVCALAVAGLGVWLARIGYVQLAKGAQLATGIELTANQLDPRLAIYLLAGATLVWTLVSCASAGTPARRAVGAGLALIVLGGYAFKWPHHYLLPLLGVVLIAEAARTVRDDELAALPIATETPAIADPTWAIYVGQVAHGLRRALGEVHSLTTRGEAGLASTVIAGDIAGVPVRIRIERIEGSVLALDVVLGRDIDEMRGATLTAWAIPPRSLGLNPSGPPAAPIFKTGDPQFDERFKTRGSAIAFHKLFDDGLRARAVATIDGWIAYWENESVRYRVYPGRGAPLDHPMPLSDLALGRPSATPDRLIAVIELLIELARRGVVPAPATSPDPSELA